MSLDLFFGCACCCLRDLLERNHHLTHPRVTARGAPKGLVHNLLMQFFTLGSSKIEVFETCFFDIVTT